MTDLVSNIVLGLQVAVTPEHLLFCLIGVTLGTIVGVLPGIGPTMTIALLLPITYGMSAAAALIMLAGIFYGALYGGSTTAILINVPGEPAAVVTCLDGHEMAKQGRAGAALVVAAVGSFFAGTVATVLVAAFATPLSNFALLFGPADYFSLMAFGLVGAVVLARGSVAKAIAMVLMGLAFSVVGTDATSGVERMTYGIEELFDGVNFVVLAIGMFGLSEILVTLEKLDGTHKGYSTAGTWKIFRSELRVCASAIGRGTILGSLLGVLPGGGATISSFASYALEKKVSKYPERFGTGVIEGVAGPESANNAAAQTSFIPLLTLGIPANALMAMMIGAWMIHGITPGPQVVSSRPDLFWGLIASMWVGNLMLLILNLPMVGMWVKLIQVPYRLLFPAILLFCAIGSYSVAYSMVDVLLCAVFGVLGYFMIKFEFEPAPLILGFVLGSQIEWNLRLALLISHGDLSVFVTRPLSLTFLICAAVLLVLIAFPRLGRAREVAFRE